MLAVERGAEGLAFEVLANIEEGVAVVHADGQCADFNPAFVSLLGLSENETLNKARIDAILGLENERHEQQILRRFFAQTGADSWVKGRIKRLKNGDFLYTLTDDSQNNRLRKALKHAQDEFEKQTDNVLEMAAASQQATRSKTEFLNVVSHEIRTPMNAILGLSNLMQDTPLNEEQRRFTHAIIDSANRLTQLVNDMLDFSSIESGHLNLQAAPFCLSQTLEACVEVAKVLIGDKDIDLKIEIDETLPESLMGDAGRIYQILLNLLGNAIKYTTQGQVTLRVKVEDANADPVHLRLEVEDTGPGLCAVYKKRAFTVFERGNTLNAQKVQGTGLGLAICKSLIERMQGSIGFDAKRETGTLFFVHLPLFKPAATQASKSKKPLEDTQLERALHILLAEDTPASQLVAKTVLERQGHSVQVVESGLAALEAVKAHDFDVVLMDVQMPLMDGFEATARIRKLGGKKGAVPIVALSARVMDHTRQSATEIGMNAYLTKPFTPEGLRKVLANVAQSEATSAPSSQMVDSPAQLQEMFDAVGKDSFVTILDRFEDNLQEQYQALETALLNQDADAARVISHKLVGIYAQVGCEKLSRSALAVEMTSDDILCLSVGRNFIAQPRPCLAGIETLKLLHGAG